MKLKSYFASTVEAAMTLAREELGPEAMLVQSKRTVADAQKFGRYEVVFALQEAERAPAGGFGEVFASQRESAIEKLSLELEALKQRIESMAGHFPAGEPASTPRQTGRRVAELTRRLTDADVDAKLARSIATEAGEWNGPGGLQKALEAVIRADSQLGVADAERKIVALAGPPGAGKTTTLVKLAARYGLSSRRSIHLLSTDVYRVGAAEQLRLYASILGVGFQAVETPLALAQALEEQRHKDLILIDTPGWAHRDVPEIRELAAFIADEPDIDVHLVLPASNRAADVSRLVDRFEVFKPAKLLFTRLDETTRFGPLINESYRTGKPVSFLSAGELIPEDLEPATAPRIAGLIAGDAEEEREECAALCVEGRN